MTRLTFFALAAAALLCAPAAALRAAPPPEPADPAAESWPAGEKMTFGVAIGTRAWRIASGIASVATTLDEKAVYVGSDDGVVARLTAKGFVEASTQPHQLRVTHLCIGSVPELRLISVSEDRSIAGIELPSMKVLWTTRATDGIAAVANDARERRIVLVQKDGEVRIVTDTGSNTKVFRISEARPTAACLLDGGTSIAVALTTRQVVVFTLADGAETGRFGPLGEETSALAEVPSREGRKLLLAGGELGTLSLLDRAALDPLWQVTAGIDAIDHIQCAADGSVALIAGRDGLIAQYGIAAPGKPVAYDDPTDAEESVTGLVRSRITGNVYAARKHRPLQRWLPDAPAAPLGAGTGHQAGVTAMVVADGKLVTASEDRSVRVWTRDGTPAGVWERHAGPVTSLSAAKTPSGWRVISGSGDTTALIWSMDTGRAGRTLAGHRSGIYAVWLAPDGTRAATAGLDGTVRVWNTSDTRAEEIGNGKYSSTVSVLALAGGPVDGTLLAGYRNGAMIRWKTDGMTVDARWSGGAGGSVKRILWLDAGTRAVTAGPGSRVTVWDADAGTPSADITPLPGRPEDIAILTSPAGRRAVAVACNGGVVEVYGLDKDNTGQRIAALDLSSTRAGALSVAAEPDSQVLWIGTAAGPVLRYAVELPAGRPGG